MKIKDSVDITSFILNKTFLDMDSKKNTDDAILPSEYIFYVKDTSYDGDLNNKLSLIIIDKKSGYCVNNNLKFNSFEIIDDVVTININVNIKD
jgi:hypothetical protein